MTPRRLRAVLVRVLGLAVAVPLACGCTRLPSADVSPPAGRFGDPVRVSDTFDPTAMAELGLDFLANNLDCERACTPRFHTFLDRGVVSRHANWDYGDLMGRYVDGMILLRVVTGSDRHLDRERRLRAAWLATFERDGLTYRPDGPFSDHEADVFDQSSSLLALVTWYLATGDARVRGMIDRMVARLSALAVHEGGVCRFAFPTYLPDGREGPHRENWETADPAHHGGRLLEGLSGYVRATGDPAARTLAECLTEHVTATSGLFDPAREPVFTGHMHSRTSTLIGLLRLARTQGDATREDFVRAVYESAKRTGTSFGWFPEFVDPAHPAGMRTSEGEIAGDMIQLALLLAERDPAYYDDAERFARNHFFESQLRRLPPEILRDGNAAEVIGAFAGYAAPNDWGRRTMNCCAGGAARAIHLLWDRAITRGPDGVEVNLLFNGERHGVRVDSRLPYEGRVDVAALAPVRVRVRIPTWAGPRELTVVPPADPEPAVERGYVVLNLAAGQQVQITFPVPERTDEAATPAGTFQVLWKGYTVVRIVPPGKFLPLYADRDSSGSPRTVERRYFQPEKAPAW